MDKIIYTKTYPQPKIDKREILRYAGAGESNPEIEALLDDCLAEISGKLSYRVCYAEFDVADLEGGLDLGFAVVNSKHVAQNLKNCKKIVLFCATVGVEMDRLISRYSSVSPARSAMLGAIGSERVEALCNEFCTQMSAEFGKIRPRFSPGYGDFPLELQRDVFLALNPSKRIGVALNDNLFMSPLKSVTAIVGIENDK